MPSTAKKRQRLITAFVAEHALQDVAKTLHAVKIEHLPLKGALLFSTGSIAPETRSMSDIDVLVSPSQYDKACAQLLSVGWRIEGRAQTGAIFTHPKHGLPLDFHCRLFPHGLYDLQTDELIRRAKQLGGPWPDSTLSMNGLDFFAHLVGHFANSRFGGDSSRLADFRNVVDRYNLDPKPCAAHLDRNGLGRAARYTMSFCIQVDNDEFSRRTLAHLRPDPLGDWLSRITCQVVDRLPNGDKRAAWVAHALNASLPKAARSFADHGYAALVRQVGSYKP